MGAMSRQRTRRPYRRSTPNLVCCRVQRLTGGVSPRADSGRPMQGTYVRNTGTVDLEAALRPFEPKDYEGYAKLSDVILAQSAELLIPRSFILSVEGFA